MTTYTDQTPDDAGLIVRRPMGLPITAGCDTAWIRTRVSVATPLALRCSALDRCATRELSSGFPNVGPAPDSNNQSYSELVI